MKMIVKRGKNMKNEPNKNIKEKKRVVKHASGLKDDEILLFNNVEYEPDTYEIVLFFDGMPVDRFKIQELLDAAIPNTYEYQKGEKMIGESNDLKAFKEFLEKNGMVPADILQTQLNDYSRQSNSMKNVLHELIERTHGKDNLKAEERAIFCLMGWLDEAQVIRAIAESKKPLSEDAIAEFAGLPVPMVKNIIKKLADEGSINAEKVILDTLTKPTKAEDY